MTRVEPGGGGSVGIDPQLLQSMIAAMSSSAGEALTLVNGYISQLARVGLGTGSLARAGRDLAWAQDQVPMLNRRLSLARAMAGQNPGLTDVPAGAGALDFLTNQAAQAAGRSDGSSAVAAIEDRGNTDFILKDLQAHADDPAYLSAFFTALGPQGLAALGLQVTGYQQEGRQDQYQEWAATVGDAFAVATYQMPYRPDWISQLQPPGDLAADPAVPMLGAIQPFLSHGVYSASWLDPLGRYAIQQAYLQQQPGAGANPVSLDGIWTALSDNPAFAAQFYRQNFSSKSNPGDSISGIMSSPYLTSIADSAFAGLVRSATIAPAAADAGPYAANAQLTVRYFGQQDPGRPLSGPVRAVFGAITMNYFGWLARTVRAAAPGVGAQDMPGWQITASAGQWANFVQEAMHDKTTAAAMLAFYGGWVRQNEPVDWTQDPDVPTRQGFWNHTSLGYLNDFMAASYQAAGAPAGDSNTVISDIVAAGGSAFLTGLLLGPEAGVANALLEGTKDAFQETVYNGLSTAFGGGPDTTGGNGATSDLTSAQAQWDITVREWADPPNPAVPPGLKPDGTAVTPVTYMGQTYDGDVHAYEREYGGNFFDDQAGRLLALKTIQENPEALAAYNAWLQDPAVVAANGQAFGTTAAGQAWAGYARGFTGGR